ncbi:MULTISPECIES: hypothetical protein [Streptomyces]|nr:hypothetical protein [Streptomyces sp.]
MPVAVPTEEQPYGRKGLKLATSTCVPVTPIVTVSRGRDPLQ